MRQVWALQHQAEVQYSAVEWTRVKVAVGNVFVPEPQLERASRLKSTTRDVNFLQSDSKCWRYSSVLSNIILRYLGLEQNSRVSLLWLTFTSRLVSLLLRWKIDNTALVGLSFNFQVCRYSPMVTMSLLSTPCTVCQSPSACMNAMTLPYANFLRLLFGNSEV